MKYGLYLIMEEKGENPLSLDRLVTTEGFLIYPNSKIIGVWGSLDYRGQTLLEVIPWTENTPATMDNLDRVLSQIVKRLQNRIKFEREVYNGDLQAPNIRRIPEKENKNSSKTPVSAGEIHQD